MIHLKSAVVPYQPRPQRIFSLSEEGEKDDFLKNSSENEVGIIRRFV